MPGELETLFLSTKEMLSGSDAVLSDWRNVAFRYLTEIQQAVIDLEADLQSLNQEIGILEGRFREAWKQSGSDSEYSHFERIGERARALEEYLSSTVELFENTLTFRTLASEVSEVTNYLDELEQEVRENIAVFESYFDKTGRGFMQYLEAVRKLEAPLEGFSQEQLNEHKLNVIVTAIRNELVPGTVEYYEALDKAIEVQEELYEGLERRKPCLKERSTQVF